MLDAEATKQAKVAYTCVIGAKSAGKSVAITCLPKALRNHSHAYPSSMGIEYDGLNPLMLRRVSNLNGKLPLSTSSASQPTVSFVLKDEDQSEEKWDVTCLDLPGETFTDPDNHQTALAEFEKFRDKSNGAVFMIGALDLFEPEKVATVIAEISGFLEMSDKGKNRNVVIAVTMFELLLMPFGSYAAQFAASPRQMARMLKNVLGYSVGLKGLLLETNLDIRIIPVSSYGFVPGLGSPNVNPEMKRLRNGDELATTPYVEHNYYPFLIADPFIFAATGRPNDYLFKLSDIIEL